MSGGEISGNTAPNGGGGVYVGGTGTFTKTGGIIYGDTDTTHTAGNDENTAASGNGHAVYVYDASIPKIRNATAGAGVNLDSAVDRSILGGWEDFSSGGISDAVGSLSDPPVGVVAGGTIVLPGGIYDMTAPVTVGADIIITTEPGAEVTLKRNVSFIGDMITVSGPDGKMTLRAAGGGSLTLDGNSTEVVAAGSLVMVEGGGELTMESGVTLRNNRTSGIGGGGGVYVGDNSTFTMSGGKISGNIATVANGGGVLIDIGGTFTMSGGEISGNHATGSSSSGGGVYVMDGAVSFTKTGNSIIYGSVKADSSPEDSVLQNTATAGNGNAVYAVGKGQRNVTAGPGVNLNSAKAYPDAEGGWDATL
jgi:hypothetical protein